MSIGPSPQHTLVVLGLNLKIALRVLAHGADLGGGKTDNEVAAVAAFPDSDFTAGEYFGIFNIGEQLAQGRLVMTFDGSCAAETFGEIMEAFGIGHERVQRVHIVPLSVLVSHGCLEVAGGLAYFIQFFIPEFGGKR